MILTERDKKYIDKKRYEREGAENIIFEMIRLFSKAIAQKDNKSEQISSIQKMCLSVAKTRELKEDEYVFLADSIYQYAIGSGYIRVDKGRIYLTQKSKNKLFLH